MRPPTVYTVGGVGAGLPSWGGWEGVGLRIGLGFAALCEDPVVLECMRTAAPWALNVLVWAPTTRESGVSPSPATWALGDPGACLGFRDLDCSTGPDELLANERMEVDTHGRVPDLKEDITEPRGGALT